MQTNLSGPEQRVGNLQFIGAIDIVMSMDKQSEMRITELQAKVLEEKKKAEESEGRALEAEKKAKELEEKAIEAEKKAEESEKKAVEAEKNAEIVEEHMFDSPFIR